MKAGEVMSVKVVAIPINANLEETVNLLAGNGINGAPVVDRENKIIGIVTEKDIASFAERENVIPFTRLARLATQSPELRDIAVLRKSMDLLEQTLVEQVMIANVITISEETPIAEIAQLMNLHRINHLPVTDAENVLKGIVTKADVVKFLADRERYLR